MYEEPGETAGTASMFFALLAIICLPLTALNPIFLLGTCLGCIAAFVIGMCGRGFRANFGTMIGFFGIFVMVCFAVFLAFLVRDIREGRMEPPPKLIPHSSSE